MGETPMIVTPACNMLWLRGNLTEPKSMAFDGPQTMDGASFACATLADTDMKYALNNADAQYMEGESNGCIPR